MTKAKRYPIPSATHRVEETIRRSRFITTVGNAGSVDEARAFIAAVSAEFADATHNCWAYVVGSPGDTSRVGMTDAGEPHGTAGRPMLDVLLHSGIGDIVTVVTRYYGGVKLGKGGLVRAYGGGVKAAVETCPTEELVATTELELTATYADAESIRRLLSEYEAEIVEDDFGERVRLLIRLPEEHKEPFSEAARGVTKGRVEISGNPPERGGSR